MEYRPKNFILQELVCPEIYAAHGDFAWNLLSEDMLRTLQKLRETFGPLTVNNWHLQGQYRDSGLRMATSAVGAKRSQHKLGAAADCKFKYHPPAEVHAAILARQPEFPLLTVLEAIAATPTWLHFDCRPLPEGKNRIWIVEP